MTKILIVDDHPIVRRGLKEVLRDETDLSVLEAANAVEALHEIKRNHFDLAIVDVDLPGMNGLELLKEIKRHDKNLRCILSVYQKIRLP